MIGYRNIYHDSVIEQMMYSNDNYMYVILTSESCDCEDLGLCVEKLGGKIKHRLDIINGVSAYIPTSGIKSASMERAISKVYLDDKVYKLMDVSPVSVGADYANGLGLTGKGIGVAVIDTGVYPHNDLINPHNRIVGFKDFINNKTEPYDDDGHGTHVAGIVAGNGFSSSGKYMGIAPDADIIGIKVLDGDGSGSISDVIAGIQWAVNNQRRYNIKVINMSLGSKAKTSYKDDPLCRAVDRAINTGITVCAAAGNNGPKSSTINSPATNPNALVVGASNSSSNSNPIADFSSRGPTIDDLHKPDIMAPGVDITSLKNNSTEYHSLSGTSMATPIVSGCCALLYENNEDITPKEIKELLISNTDTLGSYSRDVQGYGLLNMKKVFQNIETKIPAVPSTPDEKSAPKKNFFFTNEWFFVIAIVFLLLVI